MGGWLNLLKVFWWSANRRRPAGAARTHRRAVPFLVVGAWNSTNRIIIPLKCDLVRVGMCKSKSLDGGQCNVSFEECIKNYRMLVANILKEKHWSLSTTILYIGKRTKTFWSNSLKDFCLWNDSWKTCRKAFGKSLFKREKNFQKICCIWAFVTGRVSTWKCFTCCNFLWHFLCLSRSMRSK